MTQVHLIRTTDIHRDTRMWIVCDGEHRLNGKSRETRAAVLRRWQELHGEIDRVVEYDPMSPAEAAATVVSVQEGTA